MGQPRARGRGRRKKDEVVDKPITKVTEEPTDNDKAEERPVPLKKRKVRNVAPDIETRKNTQLLNMK